MREYEEEIPFDRFIDKESKNAQIVNFLMRLFEELGFPDMRITIRRIYENDTMRISATWEDHETEGGT